MNSGSPDIDAQEMADRLLDRIDRKIDVLKELIKQADKRIEALNRTGHVLPAEIPPLEPVDQFAEREPRVRARSAGPGSPAAAAANPTDDRRSKIVQLRRKGLSTAQIAREVNVGRGEVELILNIEGIN